MSLVPVYGQDPPFLDVTTARKKALDVAGLAFSAVERTTGSPSELGMALLPCVIWLTSAVSASDLPDRKGVEASAQEENTHFASNCLQLDVIR